MKDKAIEELIKLYNSGKLSDVENKVTELIKKDKENFVLYNIFGTVLIDKKNFKEGIINYEKSLKINPNYAEGHNNLGIALYKLGKYIESINSYKHAIKIKPDFAKAYNNLGLSYKEIGKFVESINSYQEAIKINSKYAEAYNNLGVTFKELGELNKSINSYQEAIKINPNYSEAYNNIGNVYNSNQEIDNAILNYKKAIALNSNFAEAHSNLGILLKEIGQIEESKKYEKKLLKLKPDDIDIKINITLSIPPIVNSIDQIIEYRNQYMKGLDLLKNYQYFSEIPGSTLKTSFFHLSYHAKDNLEIMRNTSDLFKKIIPKINYSSKNIDKKKEKKKIKVGFVSEFLTSHTIGKLFGGLVKNIDRNKFDVLVFHAQNTKKSIIKNEIDATSNKVINLKKKIKDQHKQIENENLDIIFYPEIGMSPTIYFLAFSRLAPVQIVSWGHPETTGIGTIDYFLSSTLLEPNTKKKKYSERLICLSQFPLYYEPPKNLGPLKSRKELQLPENSRLYGCPQSLFKLHPDFDSIIEKILIKDPESYIVFIGNDGKQKYWSEILKKRWSSTINKKVLFTKSLSLLEYISLCGCVDVLLDPLHFGGGNSFLESMLVGTPSITMPGTHLKTNITAAAYKQMKISNPPIVKNEKDYIDLAVRLAQDNNKNLSLRKESKEAANKYLYNNLKTLREFEKFLEDAHFAAKFNNKLNDGQIIKI